MTSLLMKRIWAAPRSARLTRTLTTTNATTQRSRQMLKAATVSDALRSTSGAPRLRAPFSSTSAAAGGGSPGQANENFTAVATGGYEYPGIPKFSDPYAKRQWQLEHMAGAFRVFARMGFTEGASGHISVRDPVDPETFWINPYVNFLPHCHLT